MTETFELEKLEPILTVVQIPIEAIVNGEVVEVTTKSIPIVKVPIE
jgi:hypothetical protein